MSYLLDAVREAADLRTGAELEFRRALVRAAEAHSLREIAEYAGMTFGGVKWHLDRLREESDA